MAESISENVRVFMHVGPHNVRCSLKNLYYHSLTYI